MIDCTPKDVPIDTVYIGSSYTSVMNSTLQTNIKVLEEEGLEIYRVRTDNFRLSDNVYGKDYLYEYHREYKD